MSKHTFQTEVSQLLHLIIHSLYSHKEIFLRELLSNASDALDKLKYLTLTDEKFKTLAFDPRIDLEFDAKKSIFSISDNGIGMNEKDLSENLGTIARSGTRLFLSGLSGDAKRDSNLIGRFGVGFYSSFMVADSVTVTTRKAGEDAAWKWESDGKGEFSVEPAEREGFGTTVVLHLNDEGKEYAEAWTIRSIVEKYSNHLAFPIFLHSMKEGKDDEGKKGEKTPTVERINTASALWKRPKSELTEKEYNEFYQSIAHETEDPLLCVHTQAEGTMEYTTLFYVPKKAPFDMNYADYRPGVKLYVKRVFITDDDKELLPVYLRFVRGVIDSEDLPLNVSREILQQNKILVNIRSQSVNRILGEFKKLAEDEAKYADFVREYNRPLKEGLYSDFAHRDELLELVRFKSSLMDGWTGLAAYKERMPEGQKAIYYVTGDSEERLRRSPLLASYKEKHYEVLIMDDEVDEIVLPMVGKYKDLEFRAINRSDAADDLKTADDKKREKEVEPLLQKIKKALGDRVKDVKASVRLTDAPSCVVMDENDPSRKLQQIMKAMGQKDETEYKPILEVNPDHVLVRRLDAAKDESVVEDLSVVLLDQALLLEGSLPKVPADFVSRLNRLLSGA